MAPTLLQLRAEPWWNQEVRPPTLAGLGLALQQHYGVGPTAVGIKGDQGHLSGGHRSPEWIRRSRYSSSGSGDGSLLQSNRIVVGADDRNLRALDITPGAWGTAENRRRMVAATVSLDAAVKAGRVPQVRRFWGTRDGTTVYGWDALFRRVTTSDTSHLDHLHVEMYPDRVGWDHAAVFTAITGGDDMLTPNQEQMLKNLHDWAFDTARGLVDADPGTPHVTKYVPNEILAELRARPAAPPAEVDVDALAAALTPHLEAAAERAVRKVLGGLDGATPPG